MSVSPAGFARDESFARRLDAADPVAAYRERFHLPVGPDGQPVIYFCGNSLGLQPKTAEELDPSGDLQRRWKRYRAAHEGYERLVAPGGSLILGGILADEHQVVADALRARSFEMKTCRFVDGWASLLLALPARP